MKKQTEALGAAGGVSRRPQHRGRPGKPQGSLEGHGAYLFLYEETEGGLGGRSGLPGGHSAFKQLLMYIMHAH